MSNRGQNLPFTPFRPLAWFLIGSFAFVLSFRALSFPLFTSLKRCLPFASYLHGISILRGFIVLSNTFYISALSFNHGANLRLFRRIANRLFSLTYKRQNPGFVFRGFYALLSVYKPYRAYGYVCVCFVFPNRPTTGVQLPCFARASVRIRFRVIRGRIL